MTLPRIQLQLLVISVLAVTSGCGFPSNDVHWKIGLASDKGRAYLVDFIWSKGHLGPSIEKRELTTIAPAESVWISRDRSLYAAKEIKRDRTDLGEAWVRVYSRDGRCIGEFRNGNGDDRLSAPIIVGSKRVVFVDRDRRLIIGKIDLSAKPCAFVEHAATLEPSAGRLSPSAQLLPIDDAHIAVASPSGRSIRIIGLDDGSDVTVSEGRLAGVVDGAPVAVKDHKLFRITSSGHVRIPASLTIRGVKSPLNVFRLSPCGGFLLYDSGEVDGFMLRLADLRTNRDRVIRRLGKGARIGSWYDVAKDR